eukprot:760502-Hanusia_phi.AAC.1
MIGWSRGTGKMRLSIRRRRRRRRRRKVGGGGKVRSRGGAGTGGEPRQRLSRVHCLLHHDLLGDRPVCQRLPRLVEVRRVGVGSDDHHHLAGVEEVILEDPRKLAVPEGNYVCDSVRVDLVPAQSLQASPQVHQGHVDVGGLLEPLPRGLGLERSLRPRQVHDGKLAVHLRRVRGVSLAPSVRHQLDVEHGVAARRDVVHHRLRHLPVPRAIAEHLPRLLRVPDLQLPQPLDVDLSVVLLQLAHLPGLVLALVRGDVEQVVHVLVVDLHERHPDRPVLLRVCVSFVHLAEDRQERSRQDPCLVPFVPLDRESLPGVGWTVSEDEAVLTIKEPLHHRQSSLLIQRFLRSVWTKHAGETILVLVADPTAGLVCPILPVPPAIVWRTLKRNGRVVDQGDAAIAAEV